MREVYNWQLRLIGYRSNHGQHEFHLWDDAKQLIGTIEYDAHEARYWVVPVNGERYPVSDPINFAWAIGYCSTRTKKI